MLEIRGYNNNLESLIVWITVVEVKVIRVWANSDNSENFTWKVWKNLWVRISHIILEPHRKLHCLEPGKSRAWEVGRQADREAYLPPTTTTDTMKRKRFRRVTSLLVTFNIDKPVSLQTLRRLNPYWQKIQQNKGQEGNIKDHQLPAATTLAARVYSGGKGQLGQIGKTHIGQLGTKEAHKYFAWMYSAWRHLLHIRSWWCKSTVGLKNEKIE